jgi:hypothetical protein
MENTRQNLTKAQLAAIDLMIAYMEENKGKPMSFIGPLLATGINLVGALDAINAAPAVYAVNNTAANNTAVNDAVVNAMPAIINTITQAAPIFSAVAQVAAATAATPAKAKSLSATDAITALEQHITLDNLVAIRNQHLKKG